MTLKVYEKGCEARFCELQLFIKYILKHSTVKDAWKRMFRAIEDVRSLHRRRARLRGNAMPNAVVRQESASFSPTSAYSFYSQTRRTHHTDLLQTRRNHFSSVQTRRYRSFVIDPKVERCPTKVSTESAQHRIHFDVTNGGSMREQTDLALV